MKISRIEIKEYNRFKDITFDFTYPQGHEKAGKPLDKVCFIGQSGTGKTSLLNILRTIVDAHKAPEMKEITVHSEYEDVVVVSEIREGKITQNWSYANKENKEFTLLDRKKLLQNHYGDTVALIHFPSEIPIRFSPEILALTHSTTPPAVKVDSAPPVNEKVELAKKSVSTQNNPPQSTQISNKVGLLSPEPKIFDFEKTDISVAWQFFLKDIDAFKAEEERLTQQIVASLASSIEESEQSFAKFKQWKKDNINPLENLARTLNPILEFFYVKVKSDIKPDESQSLKFVELQTLEEINLPYVGWSAGIKQFILTAVPLFKLDTKNAVILVDEPEKSLYPDVQSKIIHYYRQLCPTAQFFMATHSPFVASTFDPWEVIELKFNEQGSVYQETYYEGDRHIDNFYADPKQLYWQNLLVEDEDDKDTLTDKELISIARLKAKLRKLKENNRIDTKEAKKTLKEFERLVAKLSSKV